MLINPVYKGKAAFGKRKLGPVKAEVRARRNNTIQQKYSTIYQDKENWIYIPVPKIVDEELFDLVQEQLDENKKRARIQKRKEAYLLQGIIVCQRCGYACSGRSKMTKKQKIYQYYNCNGNVILKICDNKSVRVAELEIAIWEKVKSILYEPERLISEYQQRVLENKETLLNQDIDRQESKLKRGISRLIDSYANEYINQEEFELRITEMKKRLKEVEEEKKIIKDKEIVEQEFAIMIGSIKEFAFSIKSEIDRYGWLEKRDVIRNLIKRIEVNFDDITIIFRMKEFVVQNRKNQNTQDCRRVRKRNTCPILCKASKAT